MPTISESQQLREFKNFSKNLKTTSLGVKFGKTLFSDPQKLNPKLIIDILRALGLNVPREAKIGAEIAQIIVSGQAAIKAYEDGKSLQEISNPSLGAMSAGVRLMADMGWLEDKDNNVARTLQLGADVGALIGSCGSDWQAWASLAMTAYVTNLENRGRAEMLANQAVFSGVNSYLTKEQKAFGENLNLLSSGKVGILGWLTKNIQTCPTLTAQNLRGNPELISKIPFLAELDFLPLYDVTWRASASVSDTFAGMGSFNTQSATANFSLKTVGNFKTEDEARHYLYYMLIEPRIYGYQYANNYFSKKSLSLETLSIFFAMGANISYVSPDHDYSNLFSALGLTPYETEDYILENFIDPNQKETPTFKGSMINFGGVATYKKPELSEFQKNKAQILYANKIGDYKFLQKFSEVKSRMSDFSKFPLIPDNYKMSVDRGGASFQVQEKYQGWRYIQNFSVALQYLDMVRKDPLFFDFETEELKKYSFMRDFDLYNKKVDYLFHLSLIRKINENAKGNVAYFFGVSPNKLVKINEGEQNSPGIFKVV